MELGSSFREKRQNREAVIDKKGFQVLDNKKSTFRPAAVHVRSDEPISDLVYALLATAMLACQKEEAEAVGLKYDFLQELYDHLHDKKPEESIEFTPERLDSILWLALGCDGDKTEKKRIVPFIKYGDIANFSPWSPKIRDSDAGLALRSFFSRPEHHAKPALGITSQSFGYHALHLVRNNRGTNIDFFLNAKIDIDGVEYPLQSVLIGAVAPGNFQYLSEHLPPSLHCLAKTLDETFEDGGDYHEVQEIPGDYFRVVALDFDDFPVEISPVTSVEMVDCMHRYLNFFSTRMGVTEMAIGDGNAINIGAYASNVAGHISLLTQLDPNLVDYNQKDLIKRFEWEITGLTKGFLKRKHRSQLSKRVVIKKMGQLNKVDWDSVMQGLEKAMEIYLEKVEQCFTLYEELASENLVTDEGISNFFPDDNRDLKELVTEKHFTERNVYELAKRIFSDIYTMDLANLGDFPEKACRRLEQLIWSRRTEYV